MVEPKPPADLITAYEPWCHPRSPPGTSTAGPVGALGATPMVLGTGRDVGEQQRLADEGQRHGLTRALLVDEVFTGKLRKVEDATASAFAANAGR